MFTGERLDRAAEPADRPGSGSPSRPPSPDARAVLAGDAGIHVTDEPRLALLPLAALEAREPLLLGLDAAGPGIRRRRQRQRTVRAAPGLRRRPALDRHGRDRRPRRRLGRPRHGHAGDRPARRRGRPSPTPTRGLAAHAAALVNWHRRHRHCSVCGAPTAVADGGIVRRCERCGTDHHPRTDPVVIMLVTDGDRVLLGRQPTWPPGRYSALAGFVEPGESLEEAVAREVREEAGVEVGPPEYVASQPWPFPSSLMLGFTAPWISGEPRRIDEELEDVRWFSRDDVAAAAGGSGGPSWRAAALRDREAVAGDMGPALACVLR